MKYPLTQTGLQAAPIVIVLVLLFVWLFNSWQLGKFGRPKNFDANKHKRNSMIVIVAAMIVIAVIAGIIVLK